MLIKWKRIIIYTLDVVLAIYLVIAVTSWNRPNEAGLTCNKVNINISDTNNAGFLSAEEVKTILTKANLYPLNKDLRAINPRKIEDALKVGPFVKTAQCYKAQGGEVFISITQRMPIIRIKSDKGDDYYLDDNGGILPNSKYTSDLIIASGNIDRHFAQFYLASLAKVISTSPLWLNQIEQVHVLPNKGIELIPRVGNHVIYLGNLPFGKYKSARERKVQHFVSSKLKRLEKFYRYGLSKIGWNMYSYIDLQFDNQIVCKRHTDDEKIKVSEQAEANATIETPDGSSKAIKKEITKKKPDVPMAEEGSLD